ncbi:unnamed protein product [Calypogeia fissa]
MSINTKGPGSGGQEKPKDGSDCPPESDMGGWLPKKIKVEGPRTEVHVTKPTSKKQITKALASSNVTTTVSQSKQKSAADSQRAIYQEKQSNYRVDFTKVRSAPGPSKEQWWYPDPYSGFYVPEDRFGKISKGVVEQKSTYSAKSKDKERDLSAKRWWISMEDLPDSLS